MRSVGYTLQTSVADVIDNSIAAEAPHVWIDFSPEGERHIAISDDGVGMDADQIVQAMRLAATDPRMTRGTSDLGRFGLGLKTASLAQARVLTVVSQTAAGRVGVQWNLDHLAARRTWSLLQLEAADIAALPGMGRLDAVTTGTVVLWQQLDLLESTIGTDAAALDAAMTTVREHLALVFHRFISGDGYPRLTIAMNDVKLPPLDPFLSTNPATLQSPEETFRVQGETVRVKAFTLPFLSKMSRRDRDTALVAGTLRDSQGFYIYRAGRLVIWGDWFRLEKRSDMSKLARVRVDIPNSLDHLWSLDIKKSAAIPPPAVRTQLKRLSERMVKPSRRVQAFRGRQVGDALTRLWDTVEDREGFRYTVNRSHPAVLAMQRELNPEALYPFEVLLVLLEDSFPVFDAHNRLSQDQVQLAEPDAGTAALSQARSLLGPYLGKGHTVAEFVRDFAAIEPFNRIPNLAARLEDTEDET